MRLDLIVFLCGVTWTLAQAKSGVVVTTPNTWLLDSEETICMSLHEIDFDLTTEAKVVLSGGRTDPAPITKTHVFSQGKGGCFSILLPRTKISHTAKLYIRAWDTEDAGHRYTFSQNKSINVYNAQTKVNITFIETDKAVYKPGDTVQFRFLTVKETLKPCLQTVPLVTVENPSGIRVMQWQNIDVAQQQGLASLSFKLSPDPGLGAWRITVTRADGKKQSQTFKVEKYVLPKFELQIKPPNHIPVWAETIYIEICARYTYGQAVKGNLTVTSCLKKDYDKLNMPCFNETLEIEGCYNLSYPLKTVLDKLRSVYGNIYILINATVVEEGTGNMVNTHVNTPKVSFRRYKVQFEDMPQYFKPGIEFTGKVKIIDLTGDSVEGLETSVSVENTVQEVQPYKAYTDSTGHISFNFSNLELAEKADYLFFQAHVRVQEDFGRYNNDIQEPKAVKTISVWYSPNNSTIEITKLPEKERCAGNLSVEVLLSEDRLKKNQFLYQIVVQKRIVQYGEIDKNVNQAFEGKRMTFVLKLPPSVWGDASLLIYVISGEEDIVADSQSFKIEHCLENNVTLQFNKDTYGPGDNVHMSVTAQPGSLCAYGVTDKSVLLLGGSSTVDMKEITSQIPVKSTTRIFGFHDEYCENKGKAEQNNEEEDDDDDDDKNRQKHRRNRKNRRRRPRMIMPYPSGRWISRFVDSSKAFQISHLTVLTDLILDTRPCQINTYIPLLEYGVLASMGPNVPFPEHEVLGSRRPMLSIPPGKGINYNVLSDKESMVVDSVRSFFPETWLWDIMSVSSNGTADIVTEAPDTMTEWIGRAVCTSEEYGLGISNTATMQTFQPFFVSLSLPYSAIRGETLLLPVSVFNYLSECLVISLELKDSPNYDVGGANRHELCVCEKRVTHHFALKAKTLGHINVTVTGESVKNALVCGNVIVSSMTGVRDTVIREMLVEPEGKEQEHAFSTLMCPKEGAVIEERHRWTVPTDIVPDSLRTHVAVIGDVMGPALTGLESLLKLPTGCGEQNMIIMAPNIYIMQYLTNSRVLNKEIEKKALEYMRTGYQRELQYRHPDGSYSAFGTSDESGSTWLTAFVLKSFSQASRFISIDEADLRITSDWFKKNQLENGCFRSVGRVIHKSMKGGLSESYESLAPLTAYSIVALLEAGYNPRSAFMLEAITCLAEQKYSDAYSAALVSYAFSLLGSESVLGQMGLEKLERFKRAEDGKVFWTAVESNLTDSHQVIRPIDIEITAYALLAHLHMSPDPVNDLDTLLPIVRWLTAQRNPSGGFLSTQDTVVALQALAKFADVVKSELGDVAINIKVKNEKHNFKVSMANHLLLQKEPVKKKFRPEENVDILMKATGTGCSFVQASMKYNVFNVSSGSTHTIYLDVTASRTHNNVCYRRVLNICIRYDGPDEATNMALLDVKMVTGWSPVEDTVEKLLQDSTLHVSRFEVQKKNVNIYFTELAKGKEVCLAFEVNQDIEVRNAQPGTATIYDYYDQQEVFYQAEYSLRSICGTKEELPFDASEIEDGEEHMLQQRLPAGEFPHFRAELALEEEELCPLCYQEDVDPTDLRGIFCSAKHVYRGMVKQAGLLKIQKDIISKMKINKITSVMLASHCTCPVLDSHKQWVWIISPGTDIKEVSKRKATLTLHATDAVVAVKQKPKEMERLLKRVKRSKQCRDNGLP